MSKSSVSKSLYSSMVGGAKSPSPREMRKFEIKPTIQEQMEITKQWWDTINP
jgi:hypothetical protein